jgi:methyl-accepting chemotaxis protein
LANAKCGFKNLIAGGNSSTKLEVKSKDEISEIAKLFNEYISKVNLDTQMDEKAIARLNEIALLASTGIFSIRISEKGASNGVRQAVETVNHMLDSIENATSKLTQGLIEFASANYQYKLDTSGYAGSIGSLCAGLVALGQSSSELFAMITMSGELLASQAGEMTREAEQLSSAANEQAASLEQTAAALEEMTGNIQTNSDKAVSMAKSAEEAKRATNNGAKMADETATAMVAIAEATKSINEAVMIIENIAFQTNILSPNAAVEAATAGEAGKGFAVVAQEVRNLANRSADAAKQIKALTEQAKIKSEDGLRISEDMNNGFKLIAEKIDQTAILVADVATSSREQMLGITQINDAVTQLDQVTQQNAAAAGGVSHMSQTVLELANSLLNAANKTRYDSTKRKMVCNIDMIFDTTKLKLDHVKFKESNYAKLKSGSSNLAISDHTSCDLGRWLEEHKSELISSGAWSKMQIVHEHVHSKVRDFCQRGAELNPNANTLNAIAKEIEDDTLSVFDCLDMFKIDMCEKIGSSHFEETQLLAADLRD